MSIMYKMMNEVRAVEMLTFYFGVWIGSLMLLKTLILAQYQIEFHGLSSALLGALVLAKVVLVLEHVSLGSWVKNRTALVDVILRTTLYAFGVFVVLLLEKSFEGRHEFGGFIPSMFSVFEYAEGAHVMANMICIFGSLLFYNIFSIFGKIFGEDAMIRALLQPLPA